MIGLDIIGAAHQSGTAVGAAIEDAIKKAYSPISVASAVQLMEHAYGLFAEAQQKARGGWFHRNLGAEQTIVNQMNALKAFTAQLRGQDQARAVTRDEWEQTRNYVRASLSQWAAVNEGRAYQNRVFDQFLDEVGEGLRDVPRRVGEGLLGMVPWWAWAAGALVVVGGGVVYLAPAVTAWLRLRAARAAR